MLPVATVIRGSRDILCRVHCVLRIRSVQLHIEAIFGFNQKKVPVPISQMAAAVNSPD